MGSKWLLIINRNPYLDALYAPETLPSIIPGRDIYTTTTNLTILPYRLFVMSAPPHLQLGGEIMGRDCTAREGGDNDDTWGEVVMQ